MTEKHNSPLLESPLTDASLSSDDEEQLEDIVVEEEVKVKGGKNEEGIEEEEAAAKEKEDEEEDDNSRFSIKKRVVVPSPQPQSSSSSMGEEEEESDSESAGSDSNLVPPPPENNIKFSNNTDVEKPITSSIPMAMEEANAKQKKKKSTSKTNSTVVTPMKQRPAKRSASKADNKPGEEEEQEVSKRRKKKKKNGGHDGEESKMKSSNTVWSKGDEVIILKGLLSMFENHGATKPISEMISQLHENIKASLHAEVTNNQLYDKVRKLKQKYFKGGMICGSKVYELAKKIWGTSVKEDFKVGEETADQAMAINGTGVVDSAAATSKKEGKSSRRKASNVVVSPRQLRNEVVSTKQSRSLPSFFNEVIESGMNSIVPLEEGLKGFLAKEVLGFIGSSKAKALEEKWNKLQIAEAKIYLDRIDLVKELVELVLDAIGGIEE